MNTGLGLSFWRIVNEEGVNGWSQIYAHIPFDDVELKNKGALFGIIYGQDKDGWADKDAELMAWVEEYFSSLDAVGDLKEFSDKWKEKYPDLFGAWLWVNLEGLRRELRVVKWGEVSVVLSRGGRDFDFSKNLSDGKVLKGKVEDGDRLAVLSKEVEGAVTDFSTSPEDIVNKWSKDIRDRDLAGAGLIFSFGKLIDETEDEIETVIGNSLGDAKPEKKTGLLVAKENVVNELADNKFVGPIGFKERVANMWMRLRDKRAVDYKGVVERKENVKRKKWAMFLGGLFLVLLTVSLITGSIKMRKDAELKRWQSFSEPIQKGLSDATELSVLNPTGAKKIIEEMRVSFEANKEEFVNTKHSDLLAELEKKINDTWTAVSGEKESEVEEILRIDLVRQGYKGDRLSLIKGSQVMSLDSTMGVVVTADGETKDIKVVAGKGEGLGWVDVTGDGGTPLVLSASGIRNALSGDDLVTFDAAVVKPIVLGKFGSNLYVLDSANKEIYRYAAVESGFSDRVRWLKQEENMDIIPVDMAIDSDIWVVSDSGQVERYRRGYRESFGVNGLVSGMKVTRIAVEVEGDRLALLDNVNGMVAICDKESGSCNQTLKSRKLVEARDIEFDAQGNLLVLVQGVVGILK